jgi:hypothetical protein
MTSTLSVHTDEPPVSADIRASAPLCTAPASPATPAAPLSERAAAAVLGSMLFLIVALTLLLVQSTLVEPASAAEAPLTADVLFATDTPLAADGGSLAHR